MEKIAASKEVPPYYHVLCTDGGFYGKGMFRPALARLIGFEGGEAISASLNDPLLISRIARSGPWVAPWFIPKDLENLFRYKVSKMLFSRKKIMEDLIDIMMGWRHSGFNVYSGPRIQPGDEEAISPYLLVGYFRSRELAYLLSTYAFQRTEKFWICSN